MPKNIDCEFSVSTAKIVELIKICLINNSFVGAKNGYTNVNEIFASFHKTVFSVRFKF